MDAKWAAWQPRVLALHAREVWCGVFDARGLGMLLGKGNVRECEVVGGGRRESQAPVWLSRCVV